MRRAISDWLNEKGRSSENAARKELFYKLASRVDPSWSVPWYNLGLQAKYQSDWKNSLRFSRRSAELDPTDQDAWWNLGIAATALHDWNEARRAWESCGVVLNEGLGEVSMEPMAACVRLDPNGLGEVVWGERLDPARIVLLNVPFVDSKRRFRDIVLNDGAQNGTRERNGVKIPVFDELEVWRRSSYSTFRVTLGLPNQEAEEALTTVCNSQNVGFEDWSSVRIICAECSRGNPGPHDCSESKLRSNERRFAFAAQDRKELVALLDDWSSSVPGATFSNVELALAAD